MAKIEQQALELALPIVAELGLELVDVQFVKEGGSWYLRYFIDKPEGIDFNDCQNVSRRLDSLLDSKDFIPQSYMLEVSSPGLDRPLKKDQDFLRFQGSLIDISLYQAWEGKKKFTCRLQSLTPSGEAIEVIWPDGSVKTIDRKNLAGVRLTVEI